MAIHRYTKKYARRSVKVPQIVPLGMISLGTLVLVWVIWPILSFNFIIKDFYQSVITPLADESSQQKGSITNVVLAAENTGENYIDYTNPNLWYPSKPQEAVSENVNGYLLSIPVLGIKDAKVVIGGDSLDYNLIHYGGTALPGEYGNTVIFGHSTLPALFNPKDYHTIFSNLPKLKPRQKTIPGDEIYITYDNIQFKYEIYEMTVTKPADLSPLEQRFDDSQLTLITCVPPGTYWERLNVKAKLVPP